MHVYKVAEDDIVFAGCPYSKDKRSMDDGDNRLGTGSPAPNSKYKNVGGETTLPADRGGGVVPAGGMVERNDKGHIPNEGKQAPANAAGTITMGKPTKRGRPNLPRDGEGGVWGSLFFINVEDHDTLVRKPTLGTTSCPSPKCSPQPAPRSTRKSDLTQEHRAQGTKPSQRTRESQSTQETRP